MVFSKMTQRKIEFGKLDELRQKDGKLFEMGIDLLLSLGFDHFKDEMLCEIQDEVNENFDTGKASLEEMEVLVAKMLILSMVSEIHEFPLETVLDYIAEKGWRNNEKSGC